MGDHDRRSHPVQCEPSPDSFEARSVYTDKDRVVVVTGRCRCSRHGMSVFLDPDPVGLEPAGALHLSWEVGVPGDATDGEPGTTAVHEIYDVPESVTAVLIEGVGLVPIEEPAD